MSRLVRMVEPVMQTLASPQTRRMDPSDAEELRKALGLGEQGSGTTVNAPVTVNTVAQDPEQVAYKVSDRIARLAKI